MSLQRRKLVRAKVEDFLHCYPFLLEFCSACVLSLAGAIAGFWTGLSLSTLVHALLCAVFGAVLGAIAGWFMASLGLALLFLVLAVFVPRTRWLLPAAMTVALASEVCRGLIHGFDATEFIVGLLVMFVISVFAFEIGIAIYEFARRILRGVSEADSASPLDANA